MGRSLVEKEIIFYQTWSHCLLFTWRQGLFQFRAVLNPFEEHHEDHVREQQNEEDDLREKFQQDAHSTTEEVMIDRRHADAENHVNDT